MRILKMTMALVCVTALAGCLQNDGDRAVAGALGGALIADAFGENVIGGAAVGAAAGALCDDVRLCK